MRNYELVLILDAQLGESSFEGVITRYEKQLTSTGGQMVNIDRWGLRKLAYPITKKRRNQGFYVLFQFIGEPAQLGPLEEVLKVDEDVMRHMVTAVPGEFMRIPQLAPEGEILGATRRPPEAVRPAVPRSTEEGADKAEASGGEATQADGAVAAAGESGKGAAVAGSEAEKGKDQETTDAVVAADTTESAG